jgi:hypothetical protein
MSEKNVTITFPATNGEVKRGPFFTGRKYGVPAELADEFVRHGAQVTMLGEKEAHEPHDGGHAEAFDTMRKHIAERAKAGKAPDAPAVDASTKTPPATAAASK